jgi:hypothetical protein
MRKLTFYGESYVFAFCLPLKPLPVEVDDGGKNVTLIKKVPPTVGYVFKVTLILETGLDGQRPPYCFIMLTDLFYGTYVHLGRSCKA